MTATPRQTTSADVPPLSSAAAEQAALAGEHACVYGYGVAGALLDGDDQDAAREALAEHSSRRDELGALIRALDEVPVAAHAVYSLPFTVNDTPSARKLATRLERRLTPLYADLVAAAGDRGLRRLAVSGMTSSARGAAVWSGKSQAFPGLDGRDGSPVS